MTKRHPATLLCLCVAWLLAGCAPRISMEVSRADYDLALVRVDRPAETKQRYGAVENIDLDTSNRFYYGGEFSTRQIVLGHAVSNAGADALRAALAGR